MPRRCYPVYRDLEGFGRLELVDRFADELSDVEILALAPADRAEVLAELGCVLQHGPRGLEVVAAPALDVVAEAA